MAIEGSGGFIKVSTSDVEVGKPLTHPLYDGNRKLLLKRGYVVENTHQRELLIERGLYRNINERNAPPNQGGSGSSESGSSSTESITTLEATKIRIGDPLHLQSSAEAPRLLVKLIGYLKGRGLIVTEPGADGEYVMLKDGQSFVCRFFSGQNAYAFTTVVSKQTSVPFPHVHLSYPREVRGLEIRKGARIDVDLITAVTMDVDGQSKQGAGKIVNISVGGGALRAKTPLGQKGETVGISFKVQVGEVQTLIVFDSIIRTVSHDANEPGMPYLHGLQFMDPEPHMAMALTAFVYQKMAAESR